MSNKGFTLWFTGLSGAGKSTLAQYLTPILIERGVAVEHNSADRGGMDRAALNRWEGASKRRPNQSVF